MPELAGLLLATASSGLSARELSTCGNHPTAVCLATLNVTGSEGLARALGAASIPISIAFIVLVAIVVRYLVVALLERAIRRTASGRPLLAHAVPGRAREKLAAVSPVARERLQQRTETIGSVLRSVASVFVYGIAVIEILGVIGINLAPIIAGAGVVGIAVAFGAQHLVSDFISGVFMVLEDQYGVGDIVDAGPAVGQVENVTLRVTSLRDLNGTLWHIRNGEIQRIGNLSKGWGRSVVHVTIAYDQPIAEAERLIKEAADSIWHDDQLGPVVLEEPELAGVQELAADAIVIRVLVKTAPGEQWAVERELRRRVKEAFDAAGIRYPFSQHTVWLRTTDGAPGGRASGSGDGDAGGGPADGGVGTGARATDRAPSGSEGGRRPR